jgi:hypothetical protein
MANAKSGALSASAVGVLHNNLVFNRRVETLRTDPSYWNDGVTWHSKLKPQIQFFAGTVPSAIRLLTRVRPDLLVGVSVLALLSGQMLLASLWEMWPLLAISIAGMGLYLPLTVGDRYRGGFVLILYVAALAAVRLRPDAQRTAAVLSLAVFFTMALATADYTVRLATHHVAIPGDGPNSTDQDRTAAEDLWRMGIRPGDKVRNHHGRNWGLLGTFGEGANCG